jgi:hypothetical protein
MRGTKWVTRSGAVIVVTDSAGSLIGTCITHNRGTIEVAETLYGVSMREDGVSTVLSMRMAGELASWNSGKG